MHAARPRLCMPFACSVIVPARIGAQWCFGMPEACILLPLLVQPVFVQARACIHACQVPSTEQKQRGPGTQSSAVPARQQLQMAGALPALHTHGPYGPHIERSADRNERRLVVVALPDGAVEGVDEHLLVHVIWEASVVCLHNQGQGKCVSCASVHMPHNMGGNGCGCR